MWWLLEWVFVRHLNINGRNHNDGCYCYDPTVGAGCD